MSQVITITFAPGMRTAIAAEPLEQWAYGQRLQFAGLDLPSSYQVDFSNFEFCGSSIPRVGGADGVSVPVEVLASGRNVYAFIWLQDATSGARAYRATVRVIPGPAPDPEESPEEESAVTEAINALNTAAESIPELVEAAVEEATASGEFSGVFWATYGETTAAEVAQAITEQKLVMTKRTDRYFYLSYVERFGSVPLNYWFVNVRLGVNSAYSTLYLSSTDAWEVGVQNGSIASLESPAFTGTPTAPTAEPGTDSDQLATTAFVQAAIEDIPEPGQTISEELKQALLQIARKVAYIDDQGEVYYQDLYDALYPPAELVSIAAVFNQGQTVVYDTASLDSLKAMLVVTGTYDDQSTAEIPATDYTLSGTLTPGTSTITVTCDGKTATFDVLVTHEPGVFPVTNDLTGCSNSNTAVSVTEGGSYSGTITANAGYMMTGATVSITMGGTDITGTAYSNGTISIASVTGALVITVTAVAVTLSSISAVYTQSGTVYDTDTLDSLKADLVVTAVYSDSSTATVAAADYTLSGTLTEGTSTITVSYGGKTTTFSVTVTEHVDGWFYQFNNSILSSGNHDFGFSGVQNYAQGIDGECYFHEVGTEGTASTDPLGLYALQSADVPTWGSNDFTISGWQKCVTPMRGHLFNAANYYSDATLASLGATVTVQDSPWSLSQNTAIRAKYTGLRIGTVGAKLTVDIVNAERTKGTEIKLTPPSSFDSTQWHHYALTRSGDTLYYFVDGHIVWTAALPTDLEIYSSNYIAVGNFMSEDSNNTVVQYPYSAYYDDLYVTVGTAKWTADFDPNAIVY